MRNEILFQTFHAYLLRACTLLDSEVGKQTQETYFELLRHLDPPVRSAVAPTIYGLLIHKYSDALLDLPEYRLAEAVLAQNPEFHQQVKHLDDPLTFLLHGFLRHQQSVAFKESKFLSFYQQVEEDLYSDSLTVWLVAPLYEFTMDEDSLELEPGLNIRLRSHAELKDLLFTDSIHLQFPFNYALEVVVALPKAAINGEGLPDDRIGEHLTTFSRVYDTLRLFQRGSLGIRGAWCLLPRWNFVRNFATHEAPAAALRQASGSSYHLSKASQANFLNFWRSYQEHRLPGNWLKPVFPLERACAHFLSSLHIQREEDRLLNLVLALEALLLNKDSRSAQYFSLRGAHLVSNSPDERARILTLLHRGYKIREQTVYGESILDSELPEPFESLREFNAVLSETARHIIHRFFREGKPKHALLQAVDAEIVNGNA